MEEHRKTKEEKKQEHEQFKETAKKLGYNMAVTFYMVDALQYFEDKTDHQIKQIAFNIAATGTHGIKPDGQGYRILALGEKEFSGYHLLAYYYVSWAIGYPEHLESTELPYENEYKTARQMYEGTKPKTPL